MFDQWRRKKLLIVPLYGNDLNSLCELKKYIYLYMNSNEGGMGGRIHLREKEFSVW